MSPVARRGDPDTSWEAAGKIEDLALRHARVLAEIEAGPKTDLELVANVTEYKASGVRTRRVELLDAGLIVHMGRYAEQEGSRRIVWGTPDQFKTELLALAVAGLPDELSRRAAISHEYGRKRKDKKEEGE